MDESDELLLIRKIIADVAFLRTAADEVARSYKHGDERFRTRVAIAAHFGVSQGTLSDWINGKLSLPLRVQPEKMLEVLKALGLDVNSMWNAARSEQFHTCVNPDCPTLRFYLIDGSVVARP